MSAVSVRPVRTGRDLDTFVRLPFRLYRDDPFWVPPLVSDAKATLTPSRNPFWTHAERELFLAERDDRVTGRVAAIIDRNYNEYHRSAVGFFGFLELENDPETARALLDAAAGHARSRGMKELFGPANPSLNDEAGLLVAGFDGPPFVKMTYNPQFYAGLLEQNGFAKVKDLHAYFVPLDQEAPEKVVRVMGKLKSRRGLQVRHLDLGNLKQELLYIKEIYNDAWSDNWDFAPMTDPEIDDLARQLRPIARPELCPLIFVNGEAAAMCIGLPDYNQVLKRLNGRLFPFGWLRFLVEKNRVNRCRIWALGVKRKFHGMGLDALLYYEAFLGSRKLGHVESELSWILEDNTAISRPIELWRGRIHRTYRVFRKTL